MSDFNLFIERFVGRYLKLVGVKNFTLPSLTIPASNILTAVTLLVIGTWFLNSSQFEKNRLKLGYSPTLAENFLLAARSAAEENDYTLAEQLYEMGVSGVNVDSVVLGVQSEV